MPSEKFFDNTLLNKPQLAERTGYSVSFIDKQMRRGLPCIRIGRTVRFEYEKVLDWLHKRSQ